MTGEKVFRMAQAVRKECRNSFDPLWKSGIVNEQPPSGKDWKWVCKRTLVLLYRQKKKDPTPLQANAGSLCVFDNVYNLTSILSFADLDVELESIRDLSPFWGRGQPRSWHTWMTYGPGRKCEDSTAEPSIWTLTAPTRGLPRRRAGRSSQREATVAKRQRLRQEADAAYRAVSATNDPLLQMHRQLLTSFTNFNAAFLRKQRVSELGTLVKLGVPGAVEELRRLLSTPLRVTPAAPAGNVIPAEDDTNVDPVGDEVGADSDYENVVDGDDTTVVEDPVHTPTPVVEDPSPTIEVEVPAPTPEVEAPAPTVAGVTTVPTPVVEAPTPTPAVVDTVPTPGGRRSLGTRRRRHGVRTLMYVFTYLTLLTHKQCWCLFCYRVVRTTGPCTTVSRCVQPFYNSRCTSR